LKKILEPAERRKRRDPEIKVWDRFVRIHHWLLALAFATIYLEYRKFPLHPYAGYLICILITARVVWGFSSNGAARFSAFWFQPSEMLAYCRDALSGRATYYYSHNPMGAAMVYSLLAILFITCFLGLLAYSASQQLGPFGALTPNDWEDSLILAHKSGGHLLAILVIGHLCGVLWATWCHRENYVLAMLTGLRRIPRAIPLPPGAKHPEQRGQVPGSIQNFLKWLSFKHPFIGTILLMLLIIGGFILPFIYFLVSINKLLPAY
jgi:cytochrome b